MGINTTTVVNGLASGGAASNVDVNADYTAAQAAIKGKDQGAIQLATMKLTMDQSLLSAMNGATEALAGIVKEKGRKLQPNQ